MSAAAPLQRVCWIMVDREDQALLKRALHAWANHWAEFPDLAALPTAQAELQRIETIVKRLG